VISFETSSISLKSIFQLDGECKELIESLIQAIEIIWVYCMDVFCTEILI